MKGSFLRITFLKAVSVLAFLTVALASYGQNRITVSGTVIDNASSEPLIGVTVIEKGTMNGSVTDVDGRYSIKVSPDATLLFSCMGYKDIELAASAVTGTVAWRKIRIFLTRL